MLDGVKCELADGLDFLRGPHGGLFDGLEHVEDPWLPSTATGHFEQQAVIVLFVADDVAAQVKDWQG